MQYGVARAVKGLLRALGHDELTDADDMEAIVGIAVAVVTIVIAAAFVWGVHVAIRRLARRSSRI